MNRVFPYVSAATLALLAAYSAFRAYPYGVQYHGLFYAWITYEHGLVKRGLVGTAMSLFCGTARQSCAFDWHIGGLGIVSLLVGLISWLLARRTSTASSAFLFSVTAVFCSSQFMPNLAITSGYLDVYVAAVLLAAVLAIIARFYKLAYLLAIIGPLVHEQFVFVWLGIALVLCYLASFRGGDRKELLAVSLLPFISALVLVLLHSQEAIQHLLASAPLDEDQKQGVLSVTFGQTISSAIHEMQKVFSSSSDRLWAPVLFFLAPSIAIVIGAYFRMRSGTEVLLLALAALLPLSIFFIAWDLSRFLATSTVSIYSAFAILYGATVSES